MRQSFRENSALFSEFNKNWGWFLGFGLILVLLGLLAITFSTFTTLFSVVLLGFLIFASGLVSIIDAFQFWWGKSNGFILHFFMGLVTLILGGLLLFWPIAGTLSITLLLGVFFFFLGIMRILYALAYRIPKWGYTFISGLIGLLLGYLIVAGWPNSSLIVIGLFVGIDLFFLGMGYILVALTAKRLHLLS